MFHVCTIVNDPAQRDALLASLAAAGFADCPTDVFDNSADNAHDPYATITRVVSTTAQPHVLFCHQDVRFDRGDGHAQLAAKVADLTARFPAWAVAGNAGVDAAGEHVVRITDPHGTFAAGGLPRAVVSLDENFLIVRTAVGVACSPDLSGFHLYGTDLCLNAAIRGRTAHVIDFHLTHLSGGDPTSDAFAEAERRFTARWNPKLAAGLVRTTTWRDLAMGRWPLVRRLLGRRRVANLVRRHGRAVVPSAGLADVFRLTVFAAALAVTAGRRLFAKAAS